MNICAFAASTSSSSVNRKLLQVAVDILTARSCRVELRDFEEFHVPLYDADTNKNVGLPEGALNCIECCELADATIIASPEYNASIPGTLKNLIDWVSRHRPIPWKNKRILLLSASPSIYGGNRGLWATRIPLEACGAHVFPEMFSLPNAYDAFDKEGQLKDPDIHKKLQTTLDAFVGYLTNRDAQ